MEVIVISRELIKPSTPTPPHLKQSKLSLFDQHVLSTLYVRMLLVYPSGGDVSRFQDTNTSDRMRDSLSEVLTHFYTFAGTINGNNQWIDCDDKGLEYVEARVKTPSSLDELIRCPKAEELDLLVPHDAYAYGTGFKGLSAVQVTVFEECGSMAVGVSVAHQLVDASSLAVFVDTWACIARGGEEMKAKTTLAKFDMASLLPPRDIPALRLSEEDTAANAAKKLVVRRFMFAPSKIDALKAKFTHQRLSKVEVLSALVTKCLIKVGSSSSPSQPIYAGIAINLRGRMSPPLPFHHIGNMVFPLMIKHATPEISLNDLGREFSEAIKEVDSEYVEKLLANDASLILEKFMDLYKLFGSRLFTVSSWCRFPFYEIDFGWGGPAWVAPLYMRFQDCCVLIDAKDGGVEACVILEENDMAQFASDDELLEFASPGPV